MRSRYSENNGVKGLDFKISTVIVLESHLAFSIGLEVFCEQVNKELLQQSNIYR